MKNQLAFNKLIENQNLDQGLISELQNDQKLRFEINKLDSLDAMMSQIGGYPILTKDILYPAQDEHFYEFVCQINLGELKINSLLPAHGILSFFILDDHYRSNVPNKVLYHNSIQDLELKKPPQDFTTICESFEDRSENKFLKLSFEPSISIEERLMQRVYDEIRDEKIFASFSSKNQLLGDEIGWRDPDYKWKAYLAKKGWSTIYPFVQHYQLAKYKGDNSLAIKEIKIKISEKINKLVQSLREFGTANFMYKYWKQQLEGLKENVDSVNNIIENYEHHKSESKNWIHLLGLYSENKAGINFGDGKMQFFIHQEDLSINNFDNVYCDICN